MTEGDAEVPDDDLASEDSVFDVSQPSIARIYDYVLGGAANFEVDRAAAKAVLEAFPAEIDYARLNRDFLRRAVVELATAGIDQFLDLGSGIPTVGNVHEVALRVAPHARVAYVDIDPIAVHHSRALLDEQAGVTGTVTATHADIRDPSAVLGAPGVAGLLDFSRPVAVLALGIFDILELSDPAGLIAAYRDACAPGSALVISNGSQLGASDAELDAFRAVLAETPTPTLMLRGPAEVEAMFAGYRILEPGVVPTAAWRPERPVTAEYAAQSNSLAAVGRLPERP